MKSREQIQTLEVCTNLLLWLKHHKESQLVIAISDEIFLIPTFPTATEGVSQQESKGERERPEGTGREQEILCQSKLNTQRRERRDYVFW